MTPARFIVRVVKPLLFVGLSLPASWLFFMDLGANPVETITHHTGDWALRLLLATLAITPLRRLTGWGAWLRLRRMLGLYAFFYALLHVLTYFILDREGQLSGLWEDVLERPYISVGFAVFVLLVPLALTSTDGMIRRLGRNWRRLHRLVYPAALGAVVHFLWLVKADLREPLWYLGVLALLMLARIPLHLSR
jgi:sulfoxide reductase heme-binding subunit YedZ